MRFLVDSSVLIDIFTEDPQWFEWSATQLRDCSDRGVLVVNPIIYAEVSQSFERIEELDQAIPERFVREELPWPAGFLAGKSYLEYKRRGGVRTSPLPDFYIGAHAAFSGMTLVSRDPRRFRSYFPSLEIICPA